MNGRPQLTSALSRVARWRYLPACLMGVVAVALVGIIALSRGDGPRGRPADSGCLHCERDRPWGHLWVRRLDDRLATAPERHRLDLPGRRVVAGDRRVRLCLCDLRSCDRARLIAIRRRHGVGRAVDLGARVHAAGDPRGPAFPNGRPPSPRWRPLIWASFAVMGLLAIPMAIATWPLRGPALLGSSEIIDRRGSRDRPGLAVHRDLLRVRSLPGRRSPAWSSASGAPARSSASNSSGSPSPPSPKSASWSPRGSWPCRPYAAVLSGPSYRRIAAIAILRYHLFEIDRIVSRTIAYLVITGVLVVTYAGGALVLQGSARRRDRGRGHDRRRSYPRWWWAALFQPLRRRAQTVVDRRFDRARFDAERTADEFSDRLRDETDIATVTADLDGTVREALKPTGMALWLRVRSAR